MCLRGFFWVKCIQVLDGFVLDKDDTMLKLAMFVPVSLKIPSSGLTQSLNSKLEWKASYNSKDGCFHSNPKKSSSQKGKWNDIKTSSPKLPLIQRRKLKLSHPADLAARVKLFPQRVLKKKEKICWWNRRNQRSNSYFLNMCLF